MTRQFQHQPMTRPDAEALESFMTTLWTKIRQFKTVQAEHATRLHTLMTAKNGLEAARQWKTTVMDARQQDVTVLGDDFGQAMTNILDAIAVAYTLERLNFSAADALISAPDTDIPSTPKDADVDTHGEETETPAPTTRSRATRRRQ